MPAKSGSAPRKRGRQARKLPRETPDAPPEPFFSADELVCLERQLLYNRSLKRPDTIRDAVMLAGSLARLSRNSDIVYLPSISTLDSAFESLEKQILPLQLARRYGMTELLEAWAGKGDEKASKELKLLQSMSGEHVRMALGRQAGLQACERLACLPAEDRRRELDCGITMQALQDLADLTRANMRSKLKIEPSREEFEHLLLPSEVRRTALDNLPGWRIVQGLVELAVEALMHKHDPEAMASNLERLESLVSQGRMDIASKENEKKAFRGLVALAVCDVARKPGPKAGVAQRERPEDLAVARLMRKLGIEEAVQDLERLANLDIEGLPHELGIEDSLKSLKDLKSRFGIA